METSWTSPYHLKGLMVKFGTFCKGSFIIYPWNQGCIHLSEKRLCLRDCSKTLIGEELCLFLGGQRFCEKKPLKVTKITNSEKSGLYIKMVTSHLMKETMYLVLKTLENASLVREDIVAECKFI